MHSNDPILEVEQRLRRDAARLDALHPPEDAWPCSGARYVQARRRRAVRIGFAVLTPVTVLIAAWLVFPGQSHERSRADREIARPEMPGAVTDEQQFRGSIPNRSATEVIATNAADGLTHPGVPVAPPDEAATRTGPVAIPIVVIRREGDREVISPGLLVPAHEMPVDIQSLSPAEQRAVRRVLDLEAEPYQSI